MESMGKYVRHGIAVMAAAIVGAMLPFAGLNPEMLTVEQTDQVASVTAGVETALYLFLTLIVYPVVEKWLKRFKGIDPEGFIDRLVKKRQALGINTPLGGEIDTRR